MMARTARLALHGYRWLVRPLLPPACRCGPWHPGGYDPVPD